MDNYQQLPYEKIDMVTMQMQRIIGNPQDGRFGSDPVVTINTMATYIKSKNPNTEIHVQVNAEFASHDTIVDVISKVRANIHGVGIVYGNSRARESSRRSMASQ